MERAPSATVSPAIHCLRPPLLAVHTASVNSPR